MCYFLLFTVAAHRISELIANKWSKLVVMLISGVAELIMLGK